MSPRLIECDEEVLHFVTAGGAYYFITAANRRGDIVKCRSIQPSIANSNDYASYLWVHAVQGYFLLRQRFVDGRPGSWRVVREFEVDESERNSFFEDEGDRLSEDLKA